MPNYEFLCNDCKKKFTVTMSLAAHEKRKTTCPKCRGGRVQQLFSGFFSKTSKKS